MAALLVVVVLVFALWVLVFRSPVGGLHTLLCFEHFFSSSRPRGLRVCGQGHRKQ